MGFGYRSGRFREKHNTSNYTSRREVFPSSEICHIWAHQKAPRGRCPKPGHVFFEGVTIYSYGHHFPMARLVLHKNGTVNFVLVTTRSYSVTTSSHQRAVENAITHLRKVYVYDVDTSVDTIKNNVRLFREEIRDMALRVPKARWRKIDVIRSVDGYIRSANIYCEAMKLKTRFQRPSGIDWDAEVADAERLDARREAAKEKKRALFEEQRKEWNREFERRKREFDVKAAAWMAGDRREYPTPVYHPKDSWVKYGHGVRLRIRGSRIQSSQGLAVPIEACRELTSYLERFGIASRDRVQQSIPVPEGMAVAGYPVTSITNKQVVVSCHTIPIEEVIRIARELDIELRLRGSDFGQSEISQRMVPAGEPWESQELSLV